MNKYILAFFIVCFSLQIDASEILDLGEEIRIPLPDTWKIETDSNNFPFQIYNEAHSAELLIFKSIIDESERVTTNRELKESVDTIISDIILQLPEAVLLSSTGKIDENRAIFSIDFTSIDTITNALIYQRLNGYLYDHPNNQQLLFTVWAKANSDNRKILHNELFLMQNNFSYYGPSLPFIFQAEESVNWKLSIIVLIIIVAILIFFKKYKASNSISFSEDSHFWRCHCGRQNHNNNEYCKRCGQPNKMIKQVS